MSAELAATVAAGLGMALPPAMPRELANPAAPEVTTSAALSLTALPGDGGIRTRSVAVLLADGVDAQSVSTVQAALLEAGAKVHLIAARLGQVKAARGAPVEATGTLENAPPVLFDGMVLPDGAKAVAALGTHSEVMDFISNQYRHGKTILALGASKTLMERAGAMPTLASGKADPGIVLGAAAQADQAAADFIAALGRHRHPERELAIQAR